jgi:hypothetical protein
MLGVKSNVFKTLRAKTTKSKADKLRYGRITGIEYAYKTMRNNDRLALKERTYIWQGSTILRI